MTRLVKFLLWPGAMLYGMVVLLRNKLFDFKILTSQEFRLPVISVGNITVGGTGKTPHTEYLIRLFRDDFRVAVLSRGYKRKTTDFRMATLHSGFEEIGDEPYQLKQKFPDITVAVDRNRVNGIRKIIEMQPETDIVLLDDAFQHRWVNPGINILLVDYNRPVFEDTLLPSGRLREAVSGKRRADIIIVTKVPESISPIEKRLFEEKLAPQAHQKVFFTTLKYGEQQPVFKTENTFSREIFNSPELNVLLVTGIAQPSGLFRELQEKYPGVELLRFPDHHEYTLDDLAEINRKFENLGTEPKVILTTEKDAARLVNHENHIQNRASWFFIPVEIDFLNHESDLFNRYILHYVKQNSRNSLLYKK